MYKSICGKEQRIYLCASAGGKRDCNIRLMMLHHRWDRFIQNERTACTYNERHTLSKANVRFRDYRLKSAKHF